MFCEKGAQYLMLVGKRQTPVTDTRTASPKGKGSPPQETPLSFPNQSVFCPNRGRTGAPITKPELKNQPVSKACDVGDRSSYTAPV